jgi:type IV fimbrial biogenesis protein FimT
VDRMSVQEEHFGLTLIELLIVLFILTSMIMVVLPSVRRLVIGNQILTGAEHLMASIRLTRNEALKRNLPVSMCPSTMALTGEPSCSGDYSAGWIVFSNRRRNRQLDVDDVLIKVFDGLQEGLSVTNRAGTAEAIELITYDPDGSSRGLPPIGVYALGAGIRISTLILVLAGKRLPGFL